MRTLLPNSRHSRYSIIFNVPPIKPFAVTCSFPCLFNLVIPKRTFSLQTCSERLTILHITHLLGLRTFPCPNPPSAQQGFFKFPISNLAAENFVALNASVPLQTLGSVLNSAFSCLAFSGRFDRNRSRLQSVVVAWTFPIALFGCLLTYPPWLRHTEILGVDRQISGNNQKQYQKRKSGRAPGNYSRKSLLLKSFCSRLGARVPTTLRLQDFTKLQDFTR